MTTDSMTSTATPVTVRYAEPETWQAFAICRGMDPRLWFPGRGEVSHQAIKVCRQCPVQAACLDYALANRETFGVWGGCSERQRRKLRAGARRAAA